MRVLAYWWSAARSPGERSDTRDGPGFRAHALIRATTPKLMSFDVFGTLISVRDIASLLDLLEA